jgi:crotonobetainyl-CoA:carnitine CoA-transferase CaiB-like acyl-CoA transferase
MTEAADRTIQYLNGWQFLVASSGTVGSSAASVLASLGASVTLHPHDVDLTDAASTAGYDAVICDVIQTGAGPSYLDGVAGWQSRPSDAARAWVTVSAFGLDGPARDYRGSNLVCSAAGGMLAAVSDPSGQLFEMPGQQALQSVGQLAALAALHGVSMSRDAGAPVHQDVSAQEAIAFSTIQQDLNHLLGRCAPGGSSPRYSSPVGVFECADGPIRVFVLDTMQFRRFTEVVGRPDWVEKYPTNAARVANFEVIEAALQEWIGQRSFDESERTLQAAGICATAVRPMSGLADSEQFQARGWPDQSAFTDASVALLPAVIERRDRVGAPEPRSESSLQDLRVVEVTNVLAGPLSGAILGAMGADVARLEDKERMDIYRVNGPFVDGEIDIERAAYFIGVNHTKRSVTGEANTVDEIPQRSLTWGNVMIENVGPSRLTRLGIESQSVGAGNGGLAISISGWGRSGPCAHYKGYAPNVHAFSGFEDAIIRSAGPDVSIRTSLADYLVAIWAATLATAWWLGGSTDDHRVDLSMSEVMAVRLTSLLAKTNNSTGSDENLIVTADGGPQLAVTLHSPDERQHVIDTLRDSGLLPDRDGQPDDVESALAGAAGRDVGATVQALQAAGIAAYVAKTTTTILTDDQLRDRDFFLALDHPVAGPIEVLTLPWKVADSLRSGYRPAPLFGADDEWARQAFRAD